jgi:hypothetical protein
MFKQFIRIGLFLDLCRTTLRWFVRLLRVLSSPMRTSLAFVWKRRRRTLSFTKNFLQLFKLVGEVIQMLRSLLFCNQTAHFVQVAG